MNIHQEVIFKTSRQKLFAMLIDAKKFADFTQAKADIDPVEGGRFSCFDDMITGQTIELIDAERLVQAWRVAFWNPGVYSIVHFELSQQGENETLITLDHSGFPEEHSEHLEQGWHNKYWLPMQEYIAANS